ncbi:MAG: branched-chain amino acid ABC transporter permease [Archangium sp.]|nr:branched-chain amino acid ABC transporter permease [Archangium sp.]MDP3570259.1 branched-chain amino acid ABC transporter permease [Archangium sp.]
MKSLAPVAIAIAVLALLQVLTASSEYFVYLSLLVGVNVVLAVSLNVINGMTGQFSIGHAGFMAVGAFASALLSQVLNQYRLGFLPEPVEHQLFFFISLVVGGAAAGMCGFIVGLPSLRLRGDYLAIVTLGFGEIILVVVRNTPTFGGALGLSGTPQYTSFFSVWFAVFIVVLFARRLLASPHGRNLVAIREDEVAAEAMGVDTTGYKVRAFVVSSFFAGVAGGLFAHFQSIITPGDSFSFVKSMEIVVMIVAGGLGSTTGAVVAAVVLTLLPEAMRAVFIQIGGGNVALAQSIDQLRKPIFGVLLVVMMLTRPQGIFGTHEAWDLFKRKKGARA